AAENELDDRMAATERRYLDQASPHERAAYYKMEKDEKISTLWVFEKEAERRSSPPPSTTPPLRSRRGPRGESEARGWFIKVHPPPLRSRRGAWRLAPLMIAHDRS